MFGPLNVRREGLETVYRAAGLMLAQIVKGRLEVSGIPAVLDYEALGPTLGLTVALGEVRVLVPIERAEEARALIQYEEGDDEFELDDEDNFDDEVDLFAPFDYPHDDI